MKYDRRLDYKIFYSSKNWPQLIKFIDDMRQQAQLTVSNFDIIVSFGTRQGEYCSLSLYANGEELDVLNPIFAKEIDLFLSQNPSTSLSAGKFVPGRDLWMPFENNSFFVNEKDLKNDFWTYFYYDYAYCVSELVLAYFQKKTPPKKINIIHHCLSILCKAVSLPAFPMDTKQFLYLLKENIAYTYELKNAVPLFKEIEAASNSLIEENDELIKSYFKKRESGKKNKLKIFLKAFSESISVSENQTNAPIDQIVINLIHMLLRGFCLTPAEQLFLATICYNYQNKLEYS